MFLNRPVHCLTERACQSAVSGRATAPAGGCAGAVEVVFQVTIRKQHFRNQGRSLHGPLRSQRRKHLMKPIALGGSKAFRVVAFLVLFVASLTLITYGLRNELLAMVMWVGGTIREAPVWGAFIFFFASACSVLFFFLSS